MGSPLAGSYVDLFWLPLGAGDSSGLVRTSGRLYEVMSARRRHRRSRPLFHSALEVSLLGTRYVIEMTPQWGLPAGDRGVVAEGPVGVQALGRSRLFRYEVHRWLDGVIPDLGEAVGGAQRLSDDAEHARRVLELAPDFPACTWGRDEQGTGDMWNSNSLTSWLLACSGLGVDGLAPPESGRAPGWQAGLVVAARQAASREPRKASRASDPTQ